jgi:hypothetical protein
MLAAVDDEDCLLLGKGGGDRGQSQQQWNYNGGGRWTDTSQEEGGVESTNLIISGQ